MTEEPSDIRRTKIVTTIGPATRTLEMMCELIRAGADVFRFNFSHGTEDEHAENVKLARQAAKECGKEIGILGDLPGPKLRLGDLEGGVVQLDEGAEVTITTADVVGDASTLPMSWEGLPKAVR
ncbi:MAG TPA: pyruvate kinase, partial [Solirubrobacterales bacterium]|nr:pyruvate kinase [Solirubrobacterales bacterium]